MTTQNNGSMTALEAGLEAVLFAAGDAVTIERLSAALGAAPAEVLDSVVAHELCHRKHMDHSKAFYAELYKLFPDYDRCSRWLKEQGVLLMRRMTG